MSLIALACSDTPGNPADADAGAGSNDAAVAGVGGGGAGAGGGRAPAAGVGSGAGSGAGSGGGAGSEAGTGASAGTAAPGPPVEVTASRLPTLFFRGESQICRIDENQDLVCLFAGETEWKLLEPGPFVAAAINGDSSDGHGCGAHPDGSVRCWHTGTRDPSAPLCNGTMPPCVNEGRPPPGRYLALTAGFGVSCGLTDEGTIHCWGLDSDYGAAVPPEGDDFVAIDGQAAACGLRASGEISCWGDFDTAYEREPLMQAVTQIEVVRTATCALMGDGEAQCDDEDVRLPDLRYARLSLGTSGGDNEGVCGLTADGAVACSGTPWLDRVTPSPGPYLEVANTGDTACGLRGDGIVECWGEHWGSGGGDETCELTEARLSLDGAELVFDASDNAWGESYVGGTPGWSFAESFARIDTESFSDPAFAWIVGSESGAPPWVDTDDVFVEGRDVELTHSLWALHADVASPGELLCTAEGSGSTVRGHADELLFDVRELASLGSCPGTPVDGELHLYPGSDGLSGTIDGSAYAASTWLGIGGEYWFTDRSLLKLFRTSTTSDELSWGIVITSPNSPAGAQVYCIGSGSFLPASGWTFGDLSSLGACPGGGTGTLSGCVR